MSIRELREAVEAGSRDNDFWSTVHAIPAMHITDVTLARDGSLDAAKRLHDALLPDAEWFPKISVKGPHGGILYMGRDDVTGVQVNADNPARAWLIAILRALEQEGRDG